MINAVEAAKATRIKELKQRKESEDNNFNEILKLIEDRCKLGYVSITLRNIVDANIKKRLEHLGFVVTLGGMEDRIMKNDCIISWLEKYNELYNNY